MLQPDLFFAYGLSSGLAVAAGKKLKEEDKSPLKSRYFVGVLAWLSIFYVPQIMYLLFKFPAWESMFVFQDLADVPAWFMAIYVSATMLFGTAGFYVTATFVKKGKTGAAIAQIAWSMAAATIIVFVGWDGTGLKRLMYTGGGADWANGVPVPMADFFKSQVFFTLLWLEALVLVPYGILFAKNAREGLKAG